MRREISCSTAATLAGALLLASGCEDTTAAPKEVGAYLNALPEWDSYAPPQAALQPIRSGDTVSSDETIADVPVYDPVTGLLVGLRDEKYACQTTRFTMRDTPEKIVMFSPDVELLWPGALIQGKSHRDGLGSMKGLTVRERTPIKVSIPALVTSDNFVQVDQPDQANVSQAIGTMVRSATTSDLVTPSTIQFLMEDYNSEESFALSANLSARYMGFNASASASYQRSAKERTVMVYFFEKMFEVVVEPPETPGAFFSEALTPVKLAELQALQKIGPDNPPLYVSNVVYGRMMAFTLTSTSTASQIKAALYAAYKGIFFSGSLNISAEHKKLLEEAKISVTSLGGDARATIAMIASGDWRAYFSATAPLTSAAPISYTLRNLKDGSIASVAETTQYDVRQCNLADSAFSGFILESFESENSLAGRCLATTNRICASDADCQVCDGSACVVGGATCTADADCTAACRQGSCTLQTTLPCREAATCQACAGGTCASRPDRSCATAADCADAVCQPSWACNEPVTLAWQKPETADSIFYGYVYAMHTNRGGGICEVGQASCFSNADCPSGACVGEGFYSVAYLEAPEAFRGDKLDFYRGELSFWFKPDRDIHNVPMSVTTRVCTFRFLGICFAWSDVGQVVVPAVETLRTADVVQVRDEATSFDQVVLRGGEPPYSITTLTYQPLEEHLPPGWSRHAIGLTNDPAANSDCGAQAGAPYHGCWLNEGQLATEEDLKYVLANVQDFRIRVSYPVYRALAGYCAAAGAPQGEAPPPAGSARVCTDSSQCAASTPVCREGLCARLCTLATQATACGDLGGTCRLEPALYGYVGGNFDEVKLVKNAP
jgi:hypothetical protein